MAVYVPLKSSTNYFVAIMRDDRPHVEEMHNRAAPYWAVAMVVCCVVGVSTTKLSLGGFWNAYVLDITGPAWNYVLFRGLAFTYSSNVWTRLFTPTRTIFIFVIVAFGIESAQWLELYESTFDPWDFVAYISLLVPMYLIDRKIER